MPKFEVSLTKTETYSMAIEVTAKDAETAEEKAQDILGDQKKLEAYMTKNDVGWDMDDEDIEIDQISEL
jgi:hypothetical protein